MRATFLTFLAYALITFAAPISIDISSSTVAVETDISSSIVAVETDSTALSVTQTSVAVPTASLTATAPAPSSSSVVPSAYPTGVQQDGDDGDDTQDENDDAPDGDENGEDEDDEDEDEDEDDEDEDDEDEDDEDEDDEDEDDEDEDDEDEDEDDEDGSEDGDECEDTGDDDDCEHSDNSERSHEKFRVEFEIDAKTAHPFLSSILQPADAHLDVKIDLDASKVGGLLTVLLGDLNRVLDDAANLVEVGAPGGGGGFVDGAPQDQNGTLTTQTSRRASPSVDFSGDSEGKITLRARTRLHGKHDDN
ncbi:hypothetical protein FOMPIDRAFT_1043238 [Fomitopsis schrenkii]|uniref:Uncharacterized protein n=1 Tax=Fomitopsis schrenkii TaxID=2126942 RepID=S8DUT6_FOMSC|nr:hypothetical protein FOMPIDRAFT_1043238 [Fomitopsis schrenkii]